MMPLNYVNQKGILRDKIIDDNLMYKPIMMNKIEPFVD